MKELVVVSGKGGVGKSSITASLAVLLSKAGIKITVIDADVDAPNLSIILGSEALNYTPVQSSEKASIDLTKCIGCNKCVSICKAGALMNIKDKAPTLIPFLCEGCGACSVACPTGAISIVQTINGKIGITETPYGFKLVSGQLSMGESSSGHIVTEVKARGRAIAGDSKSNLILVDGPPGIGCPVIASVAGADYALVITEPTPAAGSSLSRMLSVLAHFKIATSAVINKFDLNPDYSKVMEDWIQLDWGTPVVQKIPSDENVPLSLSKRVPVVEYDPNCKASRALLSLSDRILKEI
ncbi:TPA: (4Fe-4S)-binding protein [Candidatus Bathyarchaeota archaeon]|nr:(4Fe-4S)-binding protein [Candidatus Bathyarchaeota archaeon]